VADVLQAIGGDDAAAHLGAFDANTIATRLMGDSIYINPMILGYAWQKGWVPLRRASLHRAIELNDVAVANNLAAFEWGRRCAHDLSAVLASMQPAQIVQFKKRTPLEDVIAQREAFLTDYQNAAYAATYRAFVDQVLAQGSPALAEAVARNLFKLMAYKDEYEVARLHTDTGFLQRIAQQFEGDYQVVYHLAPPLLAQRNDKGELQKRRYGSAMRWGFQVLARMKGLRGTAWDVFGYTDERRTERALIGQYRASIDQVLAQFSPERQTLALEIARIPEQIKGFGHVKERHLHAARQQWDALMDRWAQPPAEQRQA
jgi:indolepyruvate ferredoxin oxidoreductase